MLSCPVRAFVNFRTNFCSFNHCLMSAFKWKKGSQVCAFYSRKCLCFLAIVLNLPLLAQMSVSVCTFILPLYLFITPFSSGCLIVSVCSLAILMAARLIVYFAETAKMLLFLYSVVSVVFFSLLFSFLTHVFHHQPSCPQHNPAESYKMSILSKGGGETEQA